MNQINRCKPLLGTYVDVEVKGKHKEDILLDISQEIFSKIERVESLMSFYNCDSELSYLNSNAHRHECAISNEMKDVLSQALKLSEITDGLYDITIGSELVKKGFLSDKSIRVDDDGSYKDILINGNKVKFNRRIELDLGGIAKGYAVDQALLCVKDRDVEVVINAGGDLVISDWQGKLINVKVPSHNNSDLATIEMKNIAVATSASYYFDQNKNPIISPKDKKMVSDKRSISVFASNCMLADALTKVAFLCSDALNINKKLGAEAIIVDEKGNIGELCQQ